MIPETKWQHEYCFRKYSWSISFVDDNTNLDSEIGDKELLCDIITKTILNDWHVPDTLLLSSSKIKTAFGGLEEIDAYELIF